MKRVPFVRAAAAASLALVLPGMVRAAEFDPLTTVFAPAQASILERDVRCGDARESVANIVKTNGQNADIAFTAVRDFEKCAALPRADSDNWRSYTDYLMTAAAASALIVGRVGHAASAYRRALHDLERVRGYNKPSSDLKTVTKRTLDASASGNDATEAGMDTIKPRTSVRVVTTTVRVPGGGYAPGDFSALAIAVGEAAQSELDALSKH